MTPELQAKLSSVLQEAKIDTSNTPRRTKRCDLRHGEAKLIRKLSEAEIRELNAHANPIINCNAGRYHNNQSTISEKAQTHTLQPNPACWIKLDDVARLAKLCETETELRQRITDYYQLERHNTDAMLSHREFGAMLKAFEAGRDKYYTLHKQ